ncbi:MAG: FAD-binding oxidoreductase [Actinobacteria bacterium]|nr:FAD-binding oxidoreductase [Actinomycetota bacterium]
MVIDELRAALGEKVSVNETIREHHSKDESFHTPTLPEAVVFATSTQDVATTLRICNANLTPVVAWGAGTVDREAVVAVNRYSGTELPNKDLLLLEFHGSAESTAIDIAAAREVLERHGGQGFKQTTDEAERRKLWQARHDAGLACRSHQPGGRIFSTDVCVPISRLSECIEQTQKDLAESKIYGPLVGHVGDGNFHVLLTADPNDHEAIERLEQFHTRLVKRALSLEGTCTGEHGIGVGKIDYLVSELGREAVDVMAIIKAALDPNCIMNPGKVIAETIAV